MGGERKVVPVFDGRSMNAFAERLANVLLAKHRSDFELGRMIDQLTRDELWFSWPKSAGGPFTTFADWSWNVLHFKVGKATALRRIYLDLSALSPSDDTISRALRIGWTKLYLVLRAARSAKALEQWLTRIEDHKLSEMDLRVEVMEAKPDESKRPRKRKLASDPSSSNGSDSPDADIEDAALETGDDGESDELLPAPERPPIPDPTLAAPSSSPVEGAPPSGERRIKWPLVFENVDALRIFKDGLKLVARRYPDIGPGRAAALMATHYLATAARDDEGGAAVELNSVIEAIERTYGITLEVKRVQPMKRTRAEAARDFS